MPRLPSLITSANAFRRVFRANDAQSLAALVNAFLASPIDNYAIASVSLVGSSQGPTWCLTLNGTTNGVGVNMILASAVRFAFRQVNDAAPEIEAAGAQCAAELLAGGRNALNEYLLAGAGAGPTWMVGLMGSAD